MEKQRHLDLVEPEPGEPTVFESASRDSNLVGSLVWSLRRGERWVLGPESAFLFRHCWRQLLVREAYQLDLPSTRRQRWTDGAKSMARRWVTGEPLLLDLYVAQRDDAELGISSDEIGGALYAVGVGARPLIARKTVYFGSQPDVMLRIASPLRELRAARGLRAKAEVLKATAYGPGWIYQRFRVRDGGEQRLVILQIDGDACFRELASGETLRADPRHAYAWDESVSCRLVKFGGVVDRLLRGSVPFQVEFRGPGRIWLSDLSFSDGYLGYLFTPSHWLFRLHQTLRGLLGYLNPASWV